MRVTHIFVEMEWKHKGANVMKTSLNASMMYAVAAMGEEFFIESSPSGTAFTA